MSDVEEQLLRDAWDAYNAGDVESTLAFFDAERLTVYAPPTMANAGTFHGIDGFIQWITQWNEAWDSFHTDIVELEQLGGGRVITRMRQTGIGRGSGVEVAMEAGWLFEVDGELCTYMSIHPS
ncbi:MAG: nuclear transport factor 2 family protein, partial [Solirubrobacterales bacterium]